MAHLIFLTYITLFSGKMKRCIACAITLFTHTVNWLHLCGWAWFLNNFFFTWSHLTIWHIGACLQSCLHYYPQQVFRPWLVDNLHMHVCRMHNKLRRWIVIVSDCLDEACARTAETCSCVYACACLCVRMCVCVCVCVRVRVFFKRT